MKKIGIGIVLRLEGPTAIVRFDGEDRRANLRGSLKAGPRRATQPLVTGDRVVLGTDSLGTHVIESVEPRRNLLARVDPRDPRRCQGIAANVDQLVCVQAFRDPPMNLRALDRFLLLGQACGIPSTIVMNKLDLHVGPTPPSLAFYPKIDIRVLQTSAKDGTGVSEFGDLLGRRVSVLVGPSGAGKSSLLNAVIPGLHLRTRSISRATSKGVHTTARTEWCDLPDGGVVLDTPGLRAIQPWGIVPATLAEAFVEFGDFLDCRFDDCLHRSEAGCSVRRAVEQGKLPAFRYDSYLRILASLEEDEGRVGRRGVRPRIR